jgi:hypothetical protein
MDLKENSTINRTDGSVEKPDQSKRSYSKPCLKSLGNIRSVTLGGTQGTGDSGGLGPAVQQP